MRVVRRRPGDRSPGDGNGAAVLVFWCTLLLTATVLVLRTGDDAVLDKLIAVMTLGVAVVVSAGARGSGGR